MPNELADEYQIKVSIDGGPFGTIEHTSTLRKADLQLPTLLSAASPSPATE